MYSELAILTCLIIGGSGSALHGSCQGNEHCGTLDSYCNNGTCTCKDNFTVFYDHCIQVALMTSPCTHKSNCSIILGQKSFCKSHQCVCKSFHHLYNNQCIKSKGLDEKCENSHQCYCGHDCSDRIVCHRGICACKRGFKMYGRKCIPDGGHVKLNNSSSSVHITNYLPIIIVPLYVLKHFVKRFFLFSIQ